MPEQEETPEQEEIDLFAICMRTLNQGLSRAGIKDIDLEIRKKSSASMVERLRERKELRNEADYENAAIEMVTGYIEGAKPKENVEQPAHEEQSSPGNLEKEVADAMDRISGGKVALADMEPAELDWNGIVRNAIEDRLNLEQGEYIEINPKNKALLVEDLVKLLEHHKPATAEEAKDIAKKEVSYCLEPYRNIGKVVEQPAHEEEQTPGNLEKKVSGKYNYEISRRGNIILAAMCGAIFGIAGMCSYSTFFKPINKPAVTAPANPAEGDLEVRLTRVNQALNQNNQILKNLSTQYKEGNKEIKQAIQDSAKETTTAIKEQGNRTVQASTQPAPIDYKKLEELSQTLARQGEAIITAVKQGYTEINRTNRENYQALAKAINEAGKVDPEPIAPKIPADDLLRELEGEKPKQPPATPAAVTKTPNPYSFSLTPYASYKMALSAEDKPEPMPAFGLELEIAKDDSPFSVYFGADYGEMDDSKTSSAGSLDLKSKAITARLGGKLSTSKERKIVGSIGAGARVTFEENEITGRVGTYDVDDSRKETIYGVEAGLGLEYKFNDTISLTAGATYGHNFKDDNSNVTSDLTARVGVVVKF